MNKILIAYFSATGITASVAEKLSKVTGTKIFEIKPEVPYTKTDITWVLPLARCNMEKIANKEVPVANKINNIDDFDTIIIGFPIWYFSEPLIIDSFLSEYDFTGKRIALFATSSASEINKAVDKINKLVSCEIVGAKRFGSDVTEEEVLAWVVSLNL